MSRVQQRSRLLLVLPLLAALGSSSSSSSASALEARGESSALSSSSANPIRRVVTMLQKMQEKVTEEGKNEKDLYDKFMCYCKTGAGDLTASITAAESKVTQDTSSLEAAEANKEQLDKELSEHQSDRSEAKTAVSEATALREKEASAYAKESGDYKTNIAALTKAIDALEKGVFGSFLQSSTASRLRHLTIDMDLSGPDRDMLSSFLSVSDSQGYTPQSQQVIGILKEMKDTMTKELEEAEATEKKAIADFDALVAAKEKEIAANSEAIESKTERVGQVGVNIVNLKEDLDDTTTAMTEDKKFLETLDSDCDTKTKEWEERSKTRTDELLALAETIKILNDDDALDLFKKTLPSPTLLQTKVSDKSVRNKALSVLKGKQHSDPRLSAVLIALGGRSGNFDKVLKMIDEMVTLLGQEQTDDDTKKAYCVEQLDKTEDSLKALESAHHGLEVTIDEIKEAVATTVNEIEALSAGIKALDKSVEEATELRKSENAEYKDTLAADTAAKKLILIAKNRLSQFYAPALYIPPPEQELSEEERVFVNMGGTPPPTEAPAGIAGTGVTYLQAPPAVLVQISAHRASSHDAPPPPPPETWDAYQNKEQEHNGVVAMLDMLVSDLDKELQEIEVEEKKSQKDYEQMMAESAAKRAADAEAITSKESSKAEMEMQIEKFFEEAHSTLMQANAKAEYEKDLHAECDWLLANFEARKEARAGEVDSLKKAKAILSGADFALLQATAGRRQLRGSN